MKILNYRLVILVFLVPFLYNCKKNQLGGKYELNGKVVHHAKLIPHARVFIKYNAIDFPGTDTTLYNTKIIADANGAFSIKFYKGNYFLYAFGYDDQVSQNVKGGIPVKILSDKKLNLDIAVTE